MISLSSHRISYFEGLSHWYSYAHVFRSNSELSDSFEVLFDDISLDKIIGEGAFGKVYGGRLLKQTMEFGKGRNSSQRKTDKEQQQMKTGLAVAVKMLQSMICLFQRFIIYKYGWGSKKRRFKSVQNEKSHRVIYFEFPILVISFTRRKIVIVFNFFSFEARPCICEVMGNL